MNLLSLFQRAKQYEHLAPHERAILKFIQGSIVSAVISALFAVLQLVLNKGTVTWKEVWMAAAIAATVTVFNTLIKYFTARNDPALAAVLKPAEVAAVGQIQKS
jgi:hypothetical protein